MLRNKSRGILEGHGRPLHKEGYENEGSVAGSPSPGAGGQRAGRVGGIGGADPRSLNTSVRRLEKEL